jgi:uncharacterized repeat protein (TIGR03803 family)
MPKKQSCSTADPGFAIFLTVLLVSVVAIQPAAQARKFKVLHTFHGKDGGGPEGVLVRDAAGNLYGTTGGGGTGKCGKLGCGTAFELDKTGKQVWLHSFDGGNGHGLQAGLLRDAAGNLFGTTVYGGDTSCNPPYGCGTVFKLDKSGTKEVVLHKFTGTPDGFFSQAVLVKDAAGNLYGTTSLGGTGGLGAVFKIDASGRESVLYNFTGGSDGCDPYPGVILDSVGNLYGVTFDGGTGFCNSGQGVVFKVDRGGNETVLHSFGGGSDGANPDSVLLFDSQGNLYGTTENGGSSGCGGTGCGTVFELSHDGAETVLYAFCSLSNCADGETPVGPLVRDQKGSLYGTTYFGGASHNCSGVGCGAIFKLDRADNETILHSFTGGKDGAFPSAGLTMDSSGDLYGTTQGGGATCYTSHTCGVVFDTTP